MSVVLTNVAVALPYVKPDRQSPCPRCLSAVAKCTSSSAVAKKPRDASCLSVVSFNSTKRQVRFFYC